MHICGRSAGTEENHKDLERVGSEVNAEFSIKFRFFLAVQKTMCISSRWRFRNVTLSFLFHTSAWTPSWSSAVCFLVIEPFSPYWSSVSSRQLYEGDLPLLFRPLFSVLLVLKLNICLLSIPTVQLRYWYIICDPGCLVSQLEISAK